MPYQKDNVLQFNQYMKLDKMPYIIYANNVEKSSTTKIGVYISCRYTIWSFHNIVLKDFCTSLKEHAINVINFEKKKMIPLTKKGWNCIMLHLWFPKKDYQKHFAKDKNYRKIRYHCFFSGKCRGAAHSICNLKFSVPSENSVVFCSRLNYDYHFIIK